REERATPRAIGFRGDLSAVRVESLVPLELAQVPLATFLSQLDLLDAPWRQRLSDARSLGVVLRYRARVTRQSVEVDVAQVPAASQLAMLDGTDNQFAFTTARYDTSPLVI